jgi:predicted GIY-YIG superfamily endonuclease
MGQIIRKESDFILINPKTINIDIDPVSKLKISRFEKPKPYWIYALKLEHGKYYVGFTGMKNPYDRIMQHVAGEGDGAKWTELHKPLEVMEIRFAGVITATEAKAYEQNLTWAYMKTYKTKNVRGGIFNYTGRIFRIGDRVVMGYMLDSILVGVMFLIADKYIMLRHIFNWW